MIFWFQNAFVFRSFDRGSYFPPTDPYYKVAARLNNETPYTRKAQPN